jgi:hypothetical protein
LGLYAAFLTLLATLFVAHRASAELTERSIRLGQKLDRFAALSGKLTHLTLNGQAFSVSTRVVDAPIERVLEHFVALCLDGTPRLAEEIARELAPGARLRPGTLQRFMVLRDALNDGTGTAVCLAGLGEGGLAGLRMRLATFTETWDVSELGQLRYTFLRKTGDQRTHVLLVSAEGPLALNQLVPLDGHEVTGPDLASGVRPAASTRILSAAASGTPHRVVAYRVQGSAASALSDYGARLEAAGYHPVRIPSGHGTPFEFRAAGSVLTRSYLRGTHALIATSQPDDTGSLLAVIQLDQPTPQSSGEHDELR